MTFGAGMYAKSFTIDADRLDRLMPSILNGMSIVKTDGVRTMTGLGAGPGAISLLQGHVTVNHYDKRLDTPMGFSRLASNSIPVTIKT